MWEYPETGSEEEYGFDPGVEIVQDYEGNYWIPATSLTPDPIIVGGVCILMSLVLLGVLFRSFDLIFGPNIEKLTQISPPAQTINDQQDSNTSNNQPENLVKSAETSQCEVNQAFPEKVVRWCSIITLYANKHNLDPDLVAAVIWLESGGNELAYSRNGAVGLMQVMPRDGLAASFMCVNGPCFKDRPSTEELKDPEFNVAFGTRFLAGLVRRNGNLRDALKSYGPMNAGYTYSDKVLSIYNRFNGN